MNNNFQNIRDCIEVDGSDGVGEQDESTDGGADPRSASAIALIPGCGEAAEPENGGHQVVTRRKGRRAAGTSGASKNDGRKTVFHFTQPVETAKKRKADEQPGGGPARTTLTEQVQHLKTLIVQLIDRNGQREEALAREMEKQRQEMEKQRQKMERLRQEVEGMKKLLQQDNTGRSKATYAAAAAASGPSTQQAGAITIGQASPTNDAGRPQRISVEDDKRAMTINTSRYKGEKADLAQMKAALQRGVDGYDLLQGAKISCLRQLPGENVNVVFGTEGEAKKAREETGWLKIAMPEASVKSETWYPIKTLRKEVCAEFSLDNGSSDMDFTAMKARWLSKADPWKKTGSLVIWLKSKLAAAHLLEVGEVYFGGRSCGAYCMGISKECVGGQRDVESAQDRTRRGTARARRLPSVQCAQAHIGARTGSACDILTTSDTWRHKRDSRAPRRTRLPGETRTWRIRRPFNARPPEDPTLQPLSEYTALAVVEPYIYSDRDSGEVRCGYHERWRAQTPTTHRQHTPIQFAYRAMLWVNARVQAVQVPIESHDLIAATIETPMAIILIVAGYDPNDRMRLTDQDGDLYHKLALIRNADIILTTPRFAQKAAEAEARSTRDFKRIAKSVTFSIADQIRTSDVVSIIAQLLY
ncbi:Hypothetical protein D9617_62g044170 [Elsinoe fawcettii]|nr:Hypothetical protein D9617_62g044170 [Elsinoe fawcettii]